MQAQSAGAISHQIKAQELPLGSSTNDKLLNISGASRVGRGAGLFAEQCNTNLCVLMFGRQGRQIGKFHIYLAARSRPSRARVLQATMIIPLDIAQYAQDYPPLPPHLISLGSDEVLIVELQGSLTAEGDTSGQLVGTLVIDSQTNKPTLKIGHHLLEGTIQSLPKPYAVLARTSCLEDKPDQTIGPRGERKTDGEAEDVVISSEQTNDSCLHRKNISYDVVTVVRKKIVFAKRPVPIVPTSMKS